MSEIISLDEARRRRTPGRVLRIEATHTWRRADGTLVIGHDPSRLRISAGILVVGAIVVGMWWSAHFRGIGPPILLALLAILLAVLFVPPSRLEIDREAGVLRLYSWRPASLGRFIAATDRVQEVTLAEWQHPVRGDVADTQYEIVLRIDTGETIALQDPRNAKGYVDSGRLALIADEIRRELAAKPDAEAE